MSNTAVAATETRITADLQEKVLLGGDLARLTPAERLAYYSAVCDSVGLNPLTRPFEYIQLNGRLTLYARKDCTDQLRDMPRHAISVHIEAREVVEGVYVVTARAKKADGRCDESIGAVAIANLQGEAKANAMMKAETKAKRRVTLSICGLGMLDETEGESIPEAKRPVRLPSEILAESERSQEPHEQEPPAQAEINQELAAVMPSAQDPAEPYRVKLRTCGREPQTIVQVWNAIPPELQQDCHEEFQAQLRAVEKKTKR